MIRKSCGSIFLATAAPARWRKSREEFFEKFEREKLALVCQETTAGGQKSNFNKIVSRETPKSGTRSRSEARKFASRRGSNTGRKGAGTATKKRRAKPRAQARGA